MYLSEEDALGRWIDDRCIVGKLHWCATTHLWQSWKGWAEANNEPAGSAKSFGIALDERGFGASKSQGIRGRDGISVRSEGYDPGRADAG
jgi:phage/plasmid-associated DNA primase